MNGPSKSVLGTGAELGEQVDACRRLLLSEVLLEEYKSLDQPEIEPRELEEIENEIRTCRDSQAAASSAEALDGYIVARIYRAMCLAQAAKAKALIEKQSEASRETYAERQEDLKAGDLAEVVDRAVTAEVLGFTDDLRCEFQERHANDPDEPKRQRLVESAVRTAIRRGVLGEADDAKTLLLATHGGQAKGGETVTVEDVTRIQAQTLRSALCLSGGGIRSAIFNLGILQGLARHGLLDQFDYLSTVSGGGFIGGWLSAWIYRAGLGPVIDYLKAPPQSPLKPEAAPIEHLRVYSNYLSPQPGLLSADTWTLVTSVLRNLVLNWMVFLPFLAMLLVLPRLWTAILFRSAVHTAYAEPGYLAVGVVAVWVSFTYICWHLPTSGLYTSNPAVECYKEDQRSFIVWGLVGLVISSAALAVYFWLRLEPGRPSFRWWQYLILSESVFVVPWIICVLRIYSIPEKRHEYLGLTLIVATVLIVAAQAITSYLLRFIMGAILPHHEHPFIYATFAVPLLLLLMTASGTLMAGFTSRFTNDDDQEWWARAGAWVFIVILSWITMHVLVLYGPLMILTLSTTYERIRANGISKLPWRDLAKIAGTAIGLISGFVTLVGGFSAKTPANGKEAQRSNVVNMGLSLVTILGAPIFLGFVFVLITLGTDRLLVTSIGQRIVSLSWVGGEVLPVPWEWSGVSTKCSEQHLPAQIWHQCLIEVTPFRYLVIATIFFGLLAIVMGQLISTNHFSLQYMWRNRIIRACLGASRRPGTRRPNPFTGFETYDNLLMHELRPQPDGYRPPPSKGRPLDDLPGWRSQTDPSVVFPEQAPRKLLHVLNLALNLTGGQKLQWQDRKAESFTVSPLHAGSFWLGYRRSFCYGGREGISLGAAVAISGAFASPNMGYMMTSPVVRFLMTLFNVRFGAWLGNPGPAGEKASLIERITSLPVRRLIYDLRPLRLRSPGLSVVPIVSEAFGSIDDQSSYVYLSDGGHFENLGLYEMILRRCRFIVVSDASTDPEYSFQSLAMAVRQIRVDLGVPIDIPELAVGQPSQNLKGKYCAVGTIRYSCVDRTANDKDADDADFDGVLIYLKPSLIGDEPRDIVNYWQSSNGFPQETITDQWFSEAQFESYRALGSHIIDAICDPSQGSSRNRVSLAAFARKSREHTQLNFGAFRENLSFLALETLSKAALSQMTFPSFHQRVQRFLKSILG